MYTNGFHFAYFVVDAIRPQIQTTHSPYAVFAANALGTIGK